MRTNINRLIGPALFAEQGRSTGEVAKVTEPFLTVCDQSAAHPAGGRIPLEIHWCDTRLGGTLHMGEKPISLSNADCDLFNGNLNMHFRNQELEGTVFGLELGIVLDFEELVGRSFVSNVTLGGDTKSLVYFVVDHEEYVVRSVELNSIEYLEAPRILSFHLTMTANHSSLGSDGWEYGDDVIASLHMSALAQPVTKSDVIFRGAFRTQFAEKYLPLIGFAPLSVGTTRADLVRLFGKPAAEGGGLCTFDFGTSFVNYWVRYEFPECKLRFELESDVVSTIAVLWAA